ncbi:hypothetical protein EXS71_02705 [Candidatus Uhrbacteria bacterium]|nr:hypothetical protein [Candidatus Uhrbacteria bacterium]
MSNRSQRLQLIQSFMLGSLIVSPVRRALAQRLKDPGLKIHASIYVSREADDRKRRDFLVKRYTRSIPHEDVWQNDRIISMIESDPNLRHPRFRISCERLERLFATIPASLVSTPPDHLQQEFDIIVWGLPTPEVNQAAALVIACKLKLLTFDQARELAISSPAKQNKLFLSFDGPGWNPELLPSDPELDTLRQSYTPIDGMVWV